MPVRDEHLRDRVADDVYSHPGTTRGMVEARLGITPNQARHYLRILARDGAIVSERHPRHAQRLRYFPPVDAFSEAA